MLKCMRVAKWPIHKRTKGRVILILGWKEGGGDSFRKRIQKDQEDWKLDSRRKCKGKEGSTRKVTWGRGGGGGGLGLCPYSAPLFFWLVRG